MLLLIAVPACTSPALGNGFPEKKQNDCVAQSGGSNSAGCGENDECSLFSGCNSCSLSAAVHGGNMIGACAEQGHCRAKCVDGRVVQLRNNCQCRRRNSNQMRDKRDGVRRSGDDDGGD